METDFSKEVKDKKQYELSFLIVSEEASRDVLRLVGQHKIEVMAESQLKKINFAYKIGQFTSGYFGFVTVLAFPEEIKSLEHDLKTTPAVLRSLIISLSAKRETEAGVTKEIRRSPAIRRPARSPANRPQTLSNEALEKKIEEILQ
jgi:ribosomal protein S6